MDSGDASVDAASVVKANIGADDIPSVHVGKGFDGAASSCAAGNF